MLLFALTCLLAAPEDRFRDEYRHEVAVLKRGFAEAHGRVTFQTVGNRKPNSPSTFRFAIGPARRKFEFERLVQMSPGKSSVNSYGFAELGARNIEVQKTGPSEPYQIRGIGDDDPLRRANFDAIFGKYINAPWGFGGYDIADAVARGWLSVTEAHEVEEPGRMLVEVMFHQTTMTPPTSFRAAFDPALHWAIVRASTWKEDPSKPRERYEATYGPTASGQLYTKSLHWWGLDGKERLVEFDAVEFGPTPESEFTLEHYGLKSPPLPDKGPNSKILIAILSLATVLFIAAWLLRRHAMRRD